ncbi:MAG: HAMP domain-containing protein [Acidobacteria bacterium]|nr:HAMP domain-containing protein [Acidobacteriota bacterium]
MTEPKAKAAFGKLEIATGAAILIWQGAKWLIPDSVVAPLAAIAGFCLSIATLLRWTRRLVRQSIWRLRNRLLMSYLFIAVVPVLLLGILGVLGAWILSGQVAVYMVSQAFNQDVEILKAAGRRALTPSTDGARLIQFVSGRFPGMEAVISTGEVLTRYPAESTLMHPKQPVTGVVLKGESLYGCVHLVHGARKITLLAPITKQYLQSLVPNLGEITLIDFTDQDPGAGRRFRLRSVDSAPTDILSTRAVAPAVNFADFQILWGMPMTMTDWEKPEAEGRAVLGVHTRISQVFRVIFSQKADWDQPWLIYFFYGVALTFLVVELIALGIGVAITRTMTRAVHFLHESTERVQAGDFTYRIPVKGNDQLADLGHRYNSMVENLERLLKVAKEKERLQADLDIAKEVQEQLYPRSVPRVEGLEITAKLNPAKSVSGDYYDYQRIDDQRVMIAIGDVAGKGISAALLMANVQSAMRAQLQGKTDVCTATVVSQINKHLQANTTVEKYSTFFFSVWNESSGELLSTNAGHLPPILLRNGEAIRLDVNGMVVGVFAHAEYGESRIRLEKGDLLVLYTDGITEPENEYGEMFGEDRLIETVQRIASKPGREILDDVFAAVEHWTYSPDSADDMTMVLVRRT